MAAVFQTVGRIISGWGCAAELGAVARCLGARALLVTGRGALRAAGTTDRLIASLASAGLEAFLFEQVEPEPSVDTVDRARAALRDGGCDLVAAAGGGSAIDVGKAAAALAGEQAPTAEYFAARPVPASGAPCIAIPTTAGTGAEATPNSVLTDGRAGVKQSIRAPALIPVVALVDPELTVSCPPGVTAAAGMDALTQAVESYWSRGATSLTDALALHAVRLAWRHLPTACRSGKDRPAREGMSSAALLAGMALANARLGAVHGMAHPLGCRYGIPHGVVCAALLPHVMRFNRPAVAEKYDALAQVFGSDPVEAVRGLLTALAVPARLSPLGLARADFDAIARESLPSGSLKANPRTVTARDVKDILAAVM